VLVQVTGVTVEDITGPTDASTAAADRSAAAVREVTFIRDDPTEVCEKGKLATTLLLLPYLWTGVVSDRF
jgi:hypothetical protein